MADTEQAGQSQEQVPAPEEVLDAAGLLEKEKARNADLEARLTTGGRKTKALEADLANSNSRITQLEQSLRDFQRAYEQVAPPEEKQRIASQRAAAQQAAAASSVNEAAMWEAIAVEEDPKIRKILTSMATAAKNGQSRFLSKAEVRALKESLGNEEAEPVESGKKPNANVTPVATGNTSAVSLEQKLEEAKKRRDADEVFRISSQIAAIKQRVARG